MFHHGGNLKSAAQAFPDAPLPWIDLSTGINPVPYPLPPLSAAAWTRLPEATALAALEAVAASAWRARDPATVVAAPGTQALIQWLPRLRPAQSVGMLGFTYAEHGDVWRASGARVATVADPAGLAAFDVAVIVNPNNPDGRRVSPADLLALARHMAARGGLLIVDEAFADVLPAQASLVPVMPPEGALVLRSFGKAYGLAGLRLGFAVCPPALAARLRAALGPWAISGPAIETGSAALADQAWLAASITRLASDTARLDFLLAGARFDDITGTPLFRYARHSQAAKWFARLGEAGILVRPFRDVPDRLRFGLPAGSGWARLQACLSQDHAPPARP